MPVNSDYMVFIDESGDHGIKSINQDYPIFCLVACVVRKDDYENQIVPRFEMFKDKFWGRTDVVLHENDILKSRTGPYKILSDRLVRDKFLQELSEIIEATDFYIFCHCIDKRTGIAKTLETSKGLGVGFQTVYDFSLSYIIMEIRHWLEGRGERGTMLPVFLESRGKKEDRELSNSFERIANNANSVSSLNVGIHDWQDHQFKWEFLKKSKNSVGLQLADLVARPIGLRYLRPEQENRAYKTIKNKIQTRHFWLA